MAIQTIVAPDGAELVVMPRREYDDLVDARDHATALRDVAAGVMPTLADDELDAFLAAPSPLAYWRKRRGMTQARLSAEAGISQPYLAQLEAGRRVGDVLTLRALARVLGVRIEDLVAD